MVGLMLFVLMNLDAIDVCKDLHSAITCHMVLCNLDDVVLMAIFTLLVVITGGFYPALALISSGVFGLEIFTSGLTRYELKQMSKFKVVGTVLLENVPQLICQALYAYAIRHITKGVQLAFIASFLSVIASTLGYFIDKDTSD
eukprot:1052334_1